MLVNHTPDCTRGAGGGGGHGGDRASSKERNKTDRAKEEVRVHRREWLVVFAECLVVLDDGVNGWRRFGDG